LRQSPLSPILLAFLALVFASLACNQQGQTTEDIPTLIPSIAILETSTFMTANAPPPGHREAQSFPLTDDNLATLENWHYEAILNFDGVFSYTPREVDASITANVWFNQPGNQRRVVTVIEGELLEQEENLTLEGVRLGNDTFLLRDNVCLGSVEGQAALVADLRIGDLIGGINNAIPDGHQATINGQEVWNYNFTTDDLNLPQFQLGDDSKIVMMDGELWISPQHNAVVRFYVNLDVENVRMELFGNSLPLTGLLIIRYDLYDVGVNPNITQPFGC
jgi:hypothetical protein